MSSTGEITSLGATPEAVTTALQQLWDERGASVGKTFVVTPCPYSAEAIAALERDGRRLAYLPPELATQAGRAVLGHIFPKLDCFSVLPDNVVHNVINPSGWFDYETAVDAPHVDLNQEELLALLEKEGRTLLTVNQYIVACQDSRALTGTYLDEHRTWVRINSGIDPGRILAVHIDGETVELLNEEAFEGSMIMAYDWGPEDRTPACGGRSSTVPPSAQNLLPDEKPTVPRFSITSSLASLDLDAEWQRQVDKYLSLGFHTELGFTEDQYVRTLPRFEAQPPEYTGRFDMPMLVETRMFWRQQARLGGTYVAGFDLAPEPVPADERFRTPNRPYTAWFGAWDQRFPERIAPPDARAQLKDDEVGGNPYEMVAVEILHPEFNEHGEFWDIIGYLVLDSKIGNMVHVDQERTLSVYRWRRRSEVAPNLHQRAFEIFRPLVRGAKITTSPRS